MAIIKCKMCGGDLNIIEGASTAECEFCGSVQTVPKVDDEKKLTLFARANRLRAACEFDKAAGIYEAIVADFQEEAEAYWGLVLCKYGIEYVDDPATGKKIPTCHRSSFDSIMDDSDLEQALENADPAARKVYREEAKAIEEIRKGIIAVSANEEPYDIFICYKETAEDGDRTLDSVLAQNVYDALTEKGYRVFFSRITLEDKLGQEYEPYIFAALNSAKIMLAFGTDYEYFNAVWVKNEWSRYLKLMAKDKDKHLIPCYKGIDAYDMPKEFAKLQAQDLGKVGSTQDLLRGIEKIIPKTTNEEPKVIVKEVVKEIVREQVMVQAPNANVEGQLQRGWDLLKERKWEEADAQFDRVLEQDGKNAKAYLGKLCAKFSYKVPEDLKMRDDEVAGTVVLHNGTKVKGRIKRNYSQIFNSIEFKRAFEYADEDLQKELESYRSRRQFLRDDSNYNTALELMKRRKYEDAVAAFEKLGCFLDSEEKAAECRRLANDEPDGAVCERLAEIRKRNAPVQQLMIYGLVGTDCRCHDETEDKWDTQFDLVSSVVVEIEYTREKDPSKLYESSFALCMRSWFCYGLRTDGVVVALPRYDFNSDKEDKLGVLYLDNIVRLIPSKNRLFALDKDGGLQVATLSWNDPYRNLGKEADWQNLVDIAADNSGGILGLKKDGTVVSNSDNSDYKHWKNIAVLCPGNTAFALTTDGRLVVKGGENYLNLKDEMFQWTELVAFSYSKHGSAGLKADGTVLCTNTHTYKKRYESLKNVVAISEDAEFCILADGSVVRGKEDEDSEKHKNLRLFKNIDTVRQERKELLTAKIAKLEAKRKEYQEGIAANSGLFRRKERQRYEALLSDVEQPLYLLNREHINL